MFVYLASPYSSKDESVMRHRYDAMLPVVNICLREKVPCFSPIVHWHPASISMGYSGRPISFEDFKIQNLGMIFAARELWVIALEGWANSRGVAAEVKLAEQREIPVHILDFGMVSQRCTYIRKVLEAHQFLS